MSAATKTLPMLAVAAAIASAGATRADDRSDGGDKAQMLEQTFGSTIVSTYPDGRQAEVWLKKDGTYTAEGRRHDRSSGVWQAKGDKLCLKQRHPFPAPFSFCTPAPATLSEPWSAKAFTGETVTMKLVKGIYDPAGAAKDDTRKASAGEEREPKDRG